MSRNPRNLSLLDAEDIGPLQVHSPTMQTKIIPPTSKYPRMGGFPLSTPRVTLFPLRKTEPFPKWTMDYHLVVTQVHYCL